ncbi:MAG TPA: peptide deformylase [Candidatus Avoscillospira avicola]|uniref:Peptide deformylase n=1 Tax=Candidatus Avoscillospira avicola TaxID=2840706 RepID=A0A9D1IWX5_9FIRM|nr:peptide deformylase [Candidatus Avoscillospira avicola]
MALRNIVTVGDSVLTKVSRPVTKFDRRLHQLLDDMTETLEDAGGVGLAAPQVGVLRRAVVVDTGEDGILELVNPEIIAQSGEQTGLEGCLSVPGEYGIVTRPNEVTVRAQDRDGNWFEAEGEGLIARCFCHELAHLEGQLYTAVAERMLTKEELQAMAEQQEEETP